MSNIQTIAKKVNFHIRDVKSTSDEVEQIILQVISDISHETKLFKKIIGFTVHEDIKVYDFRNITRMNEETEVELQSVTINPYTPEDIIEFLETGEWQDPEVIKTEFIEDAAQSTFVDLLDIFDENGYSIREKFKYHGTAQYYCLDDDWRKEEDNVGKAFVASVVPHIDELLEEDMLIIMPAIIEGCKYYFNDTFASTNDAQVANLYYQRYWQKKQALIDQHPTQLISTGGNYRWP